MHPWRDGCPPKTHSIPTHIKKILKKIIFYDPFSLFFSQKYPAKIKIKSVSGKEIKSAFGIRQSLI